MFRETSLYGLFLYVTTIMSFIIIIIFSIFLLVCPVMFEGNLDYAVALVNCKTEVSVHNLGLFRNIKIL